MLIRFLQALLIALTCCVPVHAQSLRLVMPTGNAALLYGEAPEFYMYTDRNFEGVRSTPWQGGQYGFVRNQERSRDGTVVFNRFHEGLDIQPLERDARGEPLDDVRSVDEGRVVYVNRNERASAYGRYVVVEHWWQGAPYYTLYAHLSDVSARTGAEVGRGERVGRIGYTGTRNRPAAGTPAFRGQSVPERPVR